MRAVQGLQRRGDSSDFLRLPGQCQDIPLVLLRHRLAFRSEVGRVDVAVGQKDWHAILGNTVSFLKPLHEVAKACALSLDVLRGGIVRARLPMKGTASDP